MRSKIEKLLPIAASSMLLLAILACGNDDDDDSPPAPVTVNPTTPPVNPTPPPVNPTAPPIANPNPSAPVPPTQLGGTTAVSLSAGFLPDPHTARGNAGGSLDASTLNPECRGWVPPAPQHTLMAQTAFPNLRVLVNSTGDTTLVIRGPDGAYHCNDDSAGSFNPTVESTMSAGAYQIWVGSYAQGQNPSYVIGFTELSSTNHAQLGN